VSEARALVTPGSVSKSATLRTIDAPDLQYGTALHIRVTRCADGSSVVSLFGELDVTSMPQFDLVTSETLSSKPKEMIFDLTQCQFVSAQGYAAIGRCSLEVPVEVRSRSGLAARVFAVLGYDRVGSFTVPAARGGTPW